MLLVQATPLAQPLNDALFDGRLSRAHALRFAVSVVCAANKSERLQMERANPVMHRIEPGAA